MLFWLSLVVIAQLVNASTVLVDKYLLVDTRGVGKPSVYAFYISLLSGFVIVLVPFGAVSWPSLSVLVLSLLTALAYIFSIFFLYSALKIAIPSDVVPVTGAVSAVTTFAFAYWWLHQDLPQGFFLGFTLLTIGTLLISHFRFNRESFSLVFLAGILFGASTFIIKLIFLQTSFVDGFFWSRMANVFMAALLLLLPANLEAVNRGIKQVSPKAKWLIIANKTLAGGAFVLILLAIKMGSVSVVNALSGLQFVFLFSFAYLGARRFPEIFHHEIRPHKFPHKLFGVIFIILGFASLFL